jgi:hypothetical protein
MLRAVLVDQVEGARGGCLCRNRKSSWRLSRAKVVLVLQSRRVDVCSKGAGIKVRYCENASRAVELGTQTRCQLDETGLVAVQG